jgi:hypothetical protein
VIGTADPHATGAVPAALALAAVLIELSSRTMTHTAYRDVRYSCGCGFRCTGMAAIDNHLDLYEDNDPAHYETSPD